YYGASITIAAGQTEGTVTVAAPTDDVYQDGETLSVNVTGAEGGNYEDLDLGNSVDTTVNDTIDTTTVTLTAPAEVSEGGSITYTATVNNAPETDLVLTLSNGASITIAAGQTEGTVTVDAPTDDVFVDAETLTVSIDNAQGGNFENLDTSDTASTLVNDTTDTVFAQISVDKSSVTEGGEITYTVTLVDANGNPVTLPSGASVSVALDWSGTATAADVDNLPPSVTISGDSQQSFTVNTINDGIYENSENLSVTISNVTDVDNSLEQLEIGSNNSADTTILDAQDAPVVRSVTGDSVIEGNANTFTVTLSTPSATNTEVTLSLSDGSAIVGTDTGLTYMVSFDGGTTYTAVTGNTVTVPPGATSFLVQVDTIDDTIFEGDENYSLNATANGAGDSGTAQITDNDSAPTVSSITGDTVVEGTANTFDVNLSNTASSATTLTLTLAGNSATKGVDFSDTEVTVTINGTAQTVSVNADGTFEVTVPANIDSFTVQVNTTDDTIFESTEDYTLSGTGANGTVTGTAHITDNDSAPTVSSITGDTVIEGTANTFDVNLSNTASSATPLTLTLAGNSATQGVDFSGTEVTVTINGTAQTVSVNEDGTFEVTVPANTDSFTVRVNTTDDTIFESTEDYTLSGTGANGTVTGTAQITDNDSAPTVSSITGDTVIEGTANTFDVNLSNTASSATPLTLTLAGNSATQGVDFSGTEVTVTINGTAQTVSVNEDGTFEVTVPANTDSFTVRVNTTDDTIFESTEDYTLSGTGANGTVTGTAQITDNDSAPTVSSITGDTVIEGTANTFDVNLSNTASSATPLTLTLAGNSATQGVDFSGTEVTVTINGTAQTVSVNEDGTFEVTVPANTDSFTVRVNTTDDTIFESTEDYTLSGTGANGTVTGTAQITDNDSAPTVSSITGDTVIEGTANTFDVNLSNTASSATPLTLTLAGNSATQGVDFSGTEVTVTINGTAQTVSVNEDGTFEVTVPANTDSFTVRVNTTDDTIFESTEDYTLSGTGANGTVTGTAQITDNDSAPTVSSITGDTVIEGTANTFDVNLSNTASSATPLTLTLAGNSATQGVDFSGTEVTVTINGTAQTVSVNEDGTFEVTVPANTDSFTVRVNTTDDTIFESTEDYTLSGTGANGTVTGTAQITDNDSAPTVSSITGDTVIEGTANTFDVNLSNTASSATPLTLTLAGNSATQGVDFSGTEVTVTINGTAQTVSVNEDGTFEVTVPANTDSFTVRVNTTDDTIFESTEDYTLSGTGANGTVTGTAQITDNDSAPTVSSITGDTVIEGTANTFDVNLSNTASSATPLTLTLAGNSATQGVDFSGTEVTVTINGTAQTVSVNEDGTFEVTVPANTDSFTVRVNTTDDTIFESTEDYTLSGTGANGTVTGTAQITDNDSAPTVSSITGDTVIEGTANTFDVNLSNTASSATPLTLTLAGNSATQGVDFSGTEVTVTINGTAQTVSVNEDGTFEVTVPANTDSFTVRVNTTDDTIFESTEDYTLSGTGANGTVTGTAQITDNDSAPTVSSITGDTVIEGTANTFDVNLSNTASSATPLTLTLAGNSATQGVDFSGTEVTVTINGTAQTVSVNEDGTFEVTVPANTDSFTVRVNTTDDTIFESTEDYTLSGTGANGTVTGTAQITDNDSAPTVSSITGDTVIEGTANTFDVNLSNTASSATPLTLTLAGNSATQGVDFSGTEVTVTINGTAQTVSVNEDGTFEVTVPANTDSFTVQVNTTDDTIFESTEDYTLSGTGANGTVTGTAQITDNDSAPTVSSITGDTVVEGTANTFDVNLSNTASSATTLTLTLAGNSATKGVDFSDTEVTVTINGTAQTVSVNADGTFEVTVPANTNNFTVQVNTTDDTIFESTEDYTLSGTGANGTVTGTAQITDNDILGGGSINLSLQDADTVGDNHDTDSSFLTFTASGAADIIDFTFGPTSGITVSGLDGNITWLVDSSSGDLVGSIDGTPMIVLSLNGGVIGSGQTGNVSVTATLLDNLQHGSVPVDIDSINITGIVINAVDSLNNSASGTVNLTVADDEVVLIAGPLNGTNAPDTYIGTLDTSGVDQAYTSDLSGNVNGWDAGSQTYFGESDITAGGKTVFFFVDPNNPDQLFAYTSDENPATAYDASNPDQTLIFTLSTDPNSDSYQLDILQSIDKLKEIDIGALVGGKGGISGTVYVTYDNATGAYDIYNDPSKVPSDAEVAFTLYGRDGNGDLADVNGTDNGFGVANPWVSGGETLIVDYADTVASASFNFNVGNNDPMLVHYKAYDANGQLLGEGEIGPNEIISDLGAIAYIELSAVTPDGAKFQLTGTTAQEIVSSTEPLDLDFEVVVTDSDGDQTTGNLDIHLDAPGGAPVAIISHALASLDEFGLQDDNLDTDQQSLRFKAGDSELSDFGFNYQNGDFSGIRVEGIRENFPLSWRLEGEYLIASMPGNGPNKDVLKISLDWSAIAAGSEGNIIVNAELIGNLPHSIDVDSLKISGIEIVGTDNNNQTAVSTLDVKVEKYTAAVDDYQEINEDQLASGNIFDNDTGELNNGQDLELASFTVAGDSQVYSAGEEVSVEGGTLVINLNGSYTFTPEANWNGTVPVITYVTNNGDTATLTIEVNSVNDAPIIVTTTNAVVSEEGLTNGLPDSNGSSDTTDSTTANGTIQLQDVDADALTVSLTPPSGITSGGQTVTWQWDAATHTLTGSVGNLAVMSVVLTPPAGNGSGDWDYQVKLLGPIDHPDTSIEDVKDLTFGVSVNDGNGGTVSGSFVVSVEDDAPYMPDTAPVTATATDIPDTLVGAFNLTGDTDDRGQLNFDGFTITARGFTSSTDHTLTSANINSSSSGIGVASVGSPYHNIDNEIDFRVFADGTGVSEKIIIDLDPNTLAFGMKIEFANIFKGELESGVAEFWRDGQLISSQTFSSDKNNGDYAADFNVQDGGFDRVVIKATDNGKAPSHGDNSDFTIKSLEFTGTGDAPAIAYASGEVTAQWGADGQGSLALAGVTDTSLVTADGEAVEVTLSGNTLLGQTDSGDLVFKLEFTPGTGHWDFYQYQTMQGTEDGDLDFAVTVTDADGDSYSGNIAVVPVFNYQVTEAGPGGQTLNLGNAEDIVIGDLDGSVVVPGQDYNIAFMVDSSGSIGYRAMEAMKLQLTQVFETLKASADSDNAGTVNIFLTDFDSQANLSVSVDLGDPDALSKLQTVIDSMDGDYWTGGGTNYEDVIKTTANWFHSDTALANSNAENLAFFITDGAPSVYQYYEDTNPIVNRKTGETLDDLVNVNNFTLGEAFYANIGGEARLIIDADGNLYQWSKDRGDWSPNYIGHIRAQGDGTYEISSTLNGNYWALQNALSALPLLTGNDVIVQAIGIGNNISTGTLQQFDSDGNVQTNVSADELAEAILGNEITDIPGSDTLDGGAGNDIIFGDVIRFDGIQGQGYSALKAFIAGELGQSDATDAEIHGYISEHPNLFDKSGINDMGDIIRGGEGSDILFGQGGNDELYGDNGNDMLFGGNGNDLLVGGNGDDWLTGGQGVDTFSWKAGETGTDHITDFELNKDKLDLSELLLGEEHNSLEQYFQFSVADGNTTISIDADLDGEFDQHIVLDGVDLFAEYGSDESDIINGLLGSNGDGPLLVDTQSANPGASYVSQSSSSGLEQSKPDEVY
ncbi:immunoglobulin-like domain-containing protein, partial [Shewanella indica]|uniref:immunoglobulin-like domain-containing protein n=2 Tax=Shewanella indica TaxID=768528 RepID=UPI001F391A2D